MRLGMVGLLLVLSILLALRIVFDITRNHYGCRLWKFTRYSADEGHHGSGELSFPEKLERATSWIEKARSKAS